MQRTMGYVTDLTDEHWRLIAPIVTDCSAEDRYKGGRPRTVALRRVVAAVLEQARTGVPWRRLPSDVPPAGTIRS